MKVKSLLPIKEPILTLDGNPVEITKTGSKTYTAVLNSNGSLEVELASINQMRNIFYESINILDDAPPAITDTILEDNVLSFRLEDSQSGIDLSLIHIYMLMEGAKEKGAFNCEPSVFRDVYQLETRAIERTGDSIFLCLITVSYTHLDVYKRQDVEL